MTNPLLAVRAVTNRQGHGRLGPVTRRAFYARARRPSPCVRFGWSSYTRSRARSLRTGAAA